MIKKEYHKLYRLIGVLAPSDDTIGFVYPVFEGVDDKKYYFQDGDENLIIQGFLPIEDFKLLNKVTLTNKFIKSNCRQEFVAKVLTYTLYCFKTDPDTVHVGNYYELKEFLKTYECRSSDVQEEIEIFLNWQK